MVYRPPTHGILTPLTMVYRPPYPWYIDPPNPWYIDPPTHGISNPLHLKKKKKGNNIGSHNIRLRTFSIVYCFLCVEKNKQKKTLKENYIVGVSVNQEI